MAVNPDHVDKTSFTIDADTLSCHISKGEQKIFPGYLEPKYFSLIMGNQLKLVDYKLTGLDDDLNLLHRNIGITIALKLEHQEFDENQFSLHLSTSIA